MIWLAWVTFGVALALAAVRIPAAIRGQNRLMLWLFALIAAAVLLSIEGPYLAIDGLLGGFNLANLLLRFLLYGIALLLAVRIAQAFGARAAQHVLLGPWGLAALGVVGACTVVSFLLMGLVPSSVGLGAGEDEFWFDIYAALGRIYPTFTGLALLPRLVLTAKGPGRPVFRVAAALLAAGYVLLTLTNTFPLMPSTWVATMQAMNYSCLLLLLGGLATIWIASWIARRRAGA